jgi:hypothetical protein
VSKSDSHDKINVPPKDTISPLFPFPSEGHIHFEQRSIYLHIYPSIYLSICLGVYAYIQ